MQTPIIFFTEAAAKHIKKAIVADAHNLGFRLSTQKSGCTGFAYLADIIQKINEGDIHFMSEEGISVYIDPASIPMVKNTILDFVNKSFLEKQLVFRNPNVKAQCGCGESFSVEEKK